MTNYYRIIENEFASLFQEVEWDDKNKNLRSTVDMADIIEYKNLPIVAQIQHQSYTISLHKSADYFQILITNNNDIVGHLQVFGSKIFPYPVVESVWVDKNHGRQGLGFAAYDLCVQTFGGIVSDQRLTGKTGYGSFDIWQKLGLKYKPFLITRIPKQNVIKKLDRTFEKTDIFDKDSEDENKTRQRFMVTK
jgi:hypothetical protein